MNTQSRRPLLRRPFLVAPLAVASAGAAAAVLLALQGSADVTSSVAPLAPAVHSQDDRPLAPGHGAAELAVALQPVGGIDPTTSMSAFLTASYADISSSWARMSAELGYPTPTATTVWPMPGEHVAGPCPTSDDTTMRYCVTDDTITFSQKAAQDMWTGQLNGLANPDHGDMSVTLLLAHEFGHNIEAELGRWDGQTPAALERGADCFAGVWANDAQSRGILDGGDLEEGYGALDLAAEHPEFNVQDNVHGSAQERIEAFEVGRTRGAEACTETYLPVTDQSANQDVDPNAHNPIPDQGYQDPSIIGEQETQLPDSQLPTQSELQVPEGY